MMKTNHYLSYLKPKSLKHHLLIATAAIDDGFFEGAVIYICEHTSEGAMGLSINKPIENLRLNDVLDQMNIPVIQTSPSKPVIKGGPVKKERGFILHNSTNDWESSIHIKNSTYLTTSQDILTAIGQGYGPKKYIFTLGFCGWDSAQIENQIANNSWLVIPATHDILFDSPISEIRRQAANTLKIDLNLLGHAHGHA